MMGGMSDEEIELLRARQQLEQAIGVISSTFLPSMKQYYDALIQNGFPKDVATAMLVSMQERFMGGGSK